MEVNSTTFGKVADKTRIILKPGRFYEITNYQRPYTWTTPQYDNLLDDIEYSVSNPKDIIPWPNILLQKTDSDDPEIEVFEVGDGQQRLTTVCICLLAIWHLAMAKTDGLEKRPDWIYELLPVVGECEDEGLLGAVIDQGVEKTIRGRVSFHAKESQTEFQRLLTVFKPKQELEYRKLLAIHQREIKIGYAFLYFRDFFEAADLGVLEHSKNVLLKRILLSAYVFDRNEDMYRAFGKMNSGGVALTEGQLIKADVYGRIRLVNRELADEIAEYWTNSYETEFWNAADKSGQKRSNLEKALEAFQDSEGVPTYDGNGQLIAKESSPLPWANGKGRWADKKSQTLYWNRKQQSRLLESYIKDPLKGPKLWWENLKYSLSWFELVHNKTETAIDYSNSTIQWEFRYTLDLLIPVLFSTLLRARRVLDDEELRQVLRDIRSYGLSIGLAHEPLKYIALDEQIVSPDSPFVKEHFTAKDVRNFLLKQTGEKAWIKDEDELVKRIANAPILGNSAGNRFLTRVFCYVSNERKLNDGNGGSMIDWFAPNVPQKRSREHILPQTSRFKLDRDEQVIYDHTVKLIGNTLILNTTLNSTANNKPLNEKLPEYTKAITSAEGEFWIPHFMEHLKLIGGAPNFDRTAVELRSLEIAKIMAPFLLAPKD